MKMSIRKPVRFTWLAATTLLAWLLPVFAWAPLAYPGYFEFHSGSLPIFNLTDLAQRLTDLGWAPTVGQPYDLLRGERALPYLLAAAARLVGASSVVAVKLVFGLSLLAGALGMFGWARRRLGGWPALVAAGNKTSISIWLVNFKVSPSTLALAFMVSVGVGILAGFVPAVRSSQLKIVDGLRKVV